MYTCWSCFDKKNTIWSHKSQQEVTPLMRHFTVFCATDWKYISAFDKEEMGKANNSGLIYLSSSTEKPYYMLCYCILVCSISYQEIEHLSKTQPWNYWHVIPVQQEGGKEIDWGQSNLQIEKMPRFIFTNCK